MTQMTQSSGVGQGQGTELTYPLSQFRQKNEKNTSIVLLFFCHKSIFSETAPTLAQCIAMHPHFTKYSSN